MRNYEDLLEEAYTNVHEDRERLKKILEELRIAAQGNIEATAGLARATMSISECLTKSNAQLVELVKIEAKGSRSDEDPEGFSEKDADSMFDEIADKENPTGEN